MLVEGEALSVRSFVCLTSLAWFREGASLTEVQLQQLAKPADSAFRGFDFLGKPLETRSLDCLAFGLAIGVGVAVAVGVGVGVGDTDWYLYASSWHGRSAHTHHHRL